MTGFLWGNASEAAWRGVMSQWLRSRSREVVTRWSPSAVKRALAVASLWWMGAEISLPR